MRSGRAMQQGDRQPVVVISEFVDEAAIDTVLSGFRICYDPDLAGNADALRDLLHDADALVVRNKTVVSRALIEAAPRLSAIGRLGVGLDNIDLDACRERHVAVYPARGSNDTAVAEYVMAAALDLVRGLPAGRDEMLSGSWPRSRMIGRELAGRTLGLLGFGATARAVAVRAMAFGMKVCAFDPYLVVDDPTWSLPGGRVLQVGFKDLLSGSSVVSVHTPLAADTRGLIGKDALACMPAGAILINTARGGVVDEFALVDSLRSGHLGGAALDVFESEPLSAAEAAMFAGIPNLVLTPHIAGVTVESNIRVSRVTLENVAAHFSRSPT